ncbi:MAG: universal stress protein [Microbacteriaceae bacterium]|jgi:nucleotide-binding universal stress UspA family protein|nr:universal stress protein [Microbacteriaceae bacterium]
MVDTPVILVGTDGSDPAHEAMQWAGTWAKAHGGKLVLLTVADLTPVSGAAALFAEAEKEATELNAHEMEYFATLSIPVPVEPRIRSGVPAAIFEEESHTADLVVVGTHKGGLFKDAFFGTRGVRIASASDAPVAVIPVLPAGTPRQGVAVGVSFDGSSQDAITFAAEEALRLNETLTLVSSWAMPVAPGYDTTWSYEVSQSLQDDTEQALQEVKKRLIEHYPALKVDTLVKEGGPVHTLADAGKTARLTVVGNHSRNALGRLLLGSVSHGLLNNITSPVVVVRLKK